jgi:15-cis-phytoene synthase
MTTPLASSYKWCTRLTRRRARNFYYGFALLPKPKRDAMCAIYAFMRYCDDLSDEPEMGGGRGRDLMARWRSELEEALAGRPGGHALWPAFLDVVERYRIPQRYFFEMIEGVSSDLEPRRFETFDELYEYCYRVASVAGLSALHIFGFDSAEALPLAEKCGIAFQLTNILRDVREDAERDRIYFPVYDMSLCGASPEEVLRGARSEAVVRLMRHEAGRARAYYAEAAPLVKMVHPESRASLWALIEIYRRVLDRIERSDYDVFSRRVRLPGWEKCWIAMRAFLRNHR